MANVDFDRVTALAKARQEEIGSTEEEVKINFVVPLLEALGHSRMRFEHKQKDIVARSGPPHGAAVVVETKRRGESLDRHLEQLERYAREEGCLPAVLTNGAEIRLYAPPWPPGSMAQESQGWVRRSKLGMGVPPSGGRRSGRSSVPTRSVGTSNVATSGSLVEGSDGYGLKPALRTFDKRAACRYASGGSMARRGATVKRFLGGALKGSL